MKDKIAWVLSGLAVGVALTAAGFMLWPRGGGPAPAAGPAGPDPNLARPSPDPKKLPFRSARRQPAELEPVDVRWPDIRPGDKHEWGACAAEHADYVQDHLDHPDLFLPAADVRGGPLVVRWPQMPGVHLHLLDKEGVPLGTSWPAPDAKPEVVRAEIGPDVDRVLVVVPPSTNFYSHDEAGRPGSGVVIPPEVLVIRLGAESPEKLPGCRPLGPEGASAGFYALSEVSQNWFALSLYRLRGVKSVHLRAQGVVLDPVVSAGAGRGDGKIAWLYLMPWPQDLTVEQALEAPAELVVEGARGRRTMVTSLPCKVDVTCRPERPTDDATLTATLSGRPGARHHAALWVWPEPREEEEPDKSKKSDGEPAEAAPAIERLIFEVAPTGEEDRIITRALEVKRRRTTWEQVGVLTVRLVPEWPR
jgi:hypothetical protein